MVLRRSLWFGFLTVASLLWVCPSIRAGSMSSVSFQCASLVVNGRSGRCTSPPLVLYPDGKYKIWGEQGTYKIEGNRLELSESRKRGRGRLLPGRQIVFEFNYRGKKHIVTFRRRKSLEAGQVIVLTVGPLFPSTHPNAPRPPLLEHPPTFSFGYREYSPP